MTYLKEIQQFSPVFLVSLVVVWAPDSSADSCYQPVPDTQSTLRPGSPASLLSLRCLPAPQHVQHRGDSGPTSGSFYSDINELNTLLRIKKRHLMKKRVPHNQVKSWKSFPVEICISWRAREISDRGDRAAAGCRAELS